MRANACALPLSRSLMACLNASAHPDAMAVSLLSVREGGFPNYHLPGDTPDRVDYGCIEACVDASLAIARAHAGRR